MTKLFRNTRNKVILLLFLTIFSPIILASGFIVWNIYQSIIAEEQKKLLAVTSILEKELQEDFQAILNKKGALNAPKQQQVRIINEELSSFTEKVVLLENVMAAGYYSRDLKANVVYAPDKYYHSRLGKDFIEGNPTEKIYQTNTPVFCFGKNSRGQVVISGYPIFRDGRLIGHTFASIPVSHIYQQLYPRAYRIISILFITFITLFLAGLIITDYVRRDIREIREFTINQLAIASKTKQKKPWLIEELPGLINNCLKINRLALEEVELVNNLREKWEFVSNYLFKKMQIGCLIADKDGIITNLNSRMLEMLEMEVEQVRGENLETVVSEILWGNQLKFLEKESWEGDLSFTSLRGKRKKLWISYSKIRGSQEELLGVILLIDEKDKKEGPC